MTLKNYRKWVNSHKTDEPLRVKVLLFQKWGYSHYLSKEWKFKNGAYIVPCTIMDFGPSGLKVHYKHKYQMVKSVIVIPYNQIVKIRTWGI